MWAKLDDALIDHRKLYVAGERIGKNGPAIALGLYAVGLMWANKQLSDGFLPREVVKHFGHVERPLEIAHALVDARLWEEVEGGFQIHDFDDHNLDAAEVQQKRKDERDRKRKWRKRRNGHES